MCRYAQERLRVQANELQDEQRQQRERRRREEYRRNAANLEAVKTEYSDEDRTAALGVLAKVALSYHDQR